MIWAVLLAAGESTRMGQLKALLPWPAWGQGGDAGPVHTTLIEYQLGELRAAPLQHVVVVLGYEAGRLLPLLPADAHAVINPDFATGKCSSIIAGVRAVPPAAHVLVLAVDQPRPRDVLARVIRSHLGGGHPVTVAGYSSRRGHPVIFAPSLRPELLSITEQTEGLRAILRRHAVSVHAVESDSPLVLVNLNTPEDYEAAVKFVLQSAPSRPPAQPPAPALETGTGESSHRRRGNG